MLQFNLVSFLLVDFDIGLDAAKHAHGLLRCLLLTKEASTHLSAASRSSEVGAERTGTLRLLLTSEGRSTTSCAKQAGRLLLLLWLLEAKALRLRCLTTSAKETHI